MVTTIEDNFSLKELDNDFKSIFFALIIFFNFLVFRCFQYDFSHATTNDQNSHVVPTISSFLANTNWKFENWAQTMAIANTGPEIW